jgi:hypothetical protein
VPLSRLKIIFATPPLFSKVYFPERDGRTGGRILAQGRLLQYSRADPGQYIFSQISFMWQNLYALSMHSGLVVDKCIQRFRHFGEGAKRLLPLKEQFTMCPSDIYLFDRKSLRRRTAD